jgi:hypothetical protein
MDLQAAEFVDEEVQAGSPWRIIRRQNVMYLVLSCDGSTERHDLGRVAQDEVSTPGEDAGISGIECEVLGHLHSGSGPHVARVGSRARLSLKTQLGPQFAPAAPLGHGNAGKLHCWCAQGSWAGMRLGKFHIGSSAGFIGSAHITCSSGTIAL